MHPVPRAVVTCSRCGEQFVDVDVKDWVAAGRTADDFSAMAETLGRAHLDTCNPRRARRARRTAADRRRRRLWWALKAGAPTIFALSAIRYLAQGELVGLLILSAALCCLLAGTESIFAFRSGYWRGRATANEPRAIDLHPADQSWNPIEHHHRHHDQGGNDA